MGVFDYDDLEVGDLVISKSITEPDPTIRIVIEVFFTEVTKYKGVRPTKMIKLSTPDRYGCITVESSYPRRFI